MKLNQQLTHIQKINSIWITDLTLISKRKYRRKPLTPCGKQRFLKIQKALSIKEKPDKRT